MERLINAIKAFFAVLNGAEPPKAAIAPVEPPKQAQAPAKEAPKNNEFEAGAVYALALLQREGRLVDFLQEDLSSCSDEQIGAASRQIHDSCAKVLKESFGLAPVANGVEGEPFALPQPFDPCDYKLSGNVPEDGKLEGARLRHKGWKAAKIALPVRAGRVKPEIVCQAEAEF